MWSNLTVGLSFALFIVWEQRHGAWSNFFEAMQGNYVIAGARENEGNQSISNKVGSGILGDIIPGAGGLELLPSIIGGLF